ncbi:MAG: T9SS type A sorting domain-containing protein [Paludibacter sp.]|nr:T9SS type A sorting domain-containing protein [Paludibacter sp.]
MKKNKLLSYLVLACMLLGFSNVQAQCPFVPLSTSGNLIVDPECGSITPYDAWGNEILISDATAYCGTSVQVTGTGTCPGSLNYNFTGLVTANTAYRLRAMMYTNGTAGITLNGFGINGTTSDYSYAVNTGSTWQLVDFVFTTGTLASNQNFWFNSCGSGNTATDMRLDNFEVYPYTAPTLSTSISVISFEGTTSASFTVTGLNQTSAVTLTAPAGVTLSTYSIPANPSAVSVTVTYDGTTTLADTIRLTSGTATAKIAVKSFSSACFTPLAPAGTNMIPDPYLNSISGFGGWGYKATVTGTEAYCGMSSVKFTALTNGWPDGAALDVSNITWTANQTYRFRAMVNATDGSVAFLAKNADPDFLLVVPQSTGWVQIDQTFTTGTNPTSGFFTFNNVDGSATGKIAYIDNYELWPVSPATAVKKVSGLSKPNIYIKGNAIVADFNLDLSSKVEISVFNAQGMLLNKIIGTFNGGKNSEKVAVNLTSGLYLVKLVQNGKSFTTKVIK